MLSFAFALAGSLGALGHLPPIGVLPNITEPKGHAVSREAIRLERGISLEFLPLAYRWYDLERKPAVVDTAGLRLDFRGAARNGFTFTLTIRTIDSSRRRFPADLMNEAWDSPVLIGRWKSFLSKLAPAIPKECRAVILANDADVMVAKHPADSAAICGFLRTGRDTLKALRPDLKVGVNVTFDGIVNRKEDCARLMEGMDVVGLSYFCVNKDLMVRPVADVPIDFAAISSFVGERRFMINQMGYPTDKDCGGSEQAQADFVGAVIKALSKVGDQCLGASFSSLIDPEDTQLDAWVTACDTGGSHLRAFLGSQGFMRHNQSLRPAWEVLRAGLQAVKR